MIIVLERWEGGTHTFLVYEERTHHACVHLYTCDPLDYSLVCVQSSSLVSLVLFMVHVLLETCFSTANTNYTYSYTQMPRDEINSKKWT